MADRSSDSCKENRLDKSLFHYIYKCDGDEQLFVAIFHGNMALLITFYNTKGGE